MKQSQGHRHQTLPPARAPRMAARGPLAPCRLSHRSLTSLGPAKFMGLVVGRLMVKSVGPSNLGGPAVDGEATATATRMASGDLAGTFRSSAKKTTHPIRQELKQMPDI